MDEILSRAGSQAVSFAIKSGISIASSFALKQITSYVVHISKDDAARIESLKSKLSNRIEIVSDAIDLIKLVNARGNTNLSSVLRLTSDLRKEIELFDTRVIELTQESKKPKPKDDITSNLEEYIKDLLARIDEITPFLNLSLTTSGANLKSELSSSISPGLLLKASNYVIQSNEKQENLCVGPVFQVTLFTMLYHLTKTTNIAWKQEMKRAFVRVVETSPYQYNLHIKQSFDDSLYHNTEEDEEVPQEVKIPLYQIARLFFSVSGKLLKLEEQDTPVLILKTDKNLKPDVAHISSTEDITWYGLGTYEEIDVSDSDSDSDSDSEEQSQKSEDNESSNSITLLEYIIRLTSLQNNMQKSILEVTDDKLAVYLNDENPNSIRRKNTSVKTITEDIKHISI